MLKTKYRHKTEVSLMEFVRPANDWPYPYSLEMAFMLFRHFLTTGEGYQTELPYSSVSVGTFLKGSNANNYYPQAITSIQDLRGRLYNAFFGRGWDCIERWREEQGVNAYGQLALKGLHYDLRRPVEHLSFESQSQLGTLLTDLLRHSAGKTTAVSLNSIHHDARVVHKVGVMVGTKGYRFDLYYGFKAPGEHDSEWSFTLAQTQNVMVGGKKKQEAFLDTFRRALDMYDFVMSPSNSHLTTTLMNDKFVPKEKPVLVD
ncbi:hypothetical protein LC612_29255 [Nostoc sp. CHAB 5834]|nr:hypothetical protein [Nostoc sp. CHAB 5834]